MSANLSNGKTSGLEATFVPSLPEGAIGNISILLGGHLTEAQKAAIAQGLSPRVDVLEMAEHFAAPIYDFVWLDQQRASRPWLRRLWGPLRALLGWSALLTLLAYRQVRTDEVVYATGEDVGLPLAVLLRLFRKQQPRVVIRMEQPVYGRTRFRRFLFRHYLRFAVGRVDFILSRTRAHARYLQMQLGVDGNKVAFTPETTDVEFFSPARETTSSVDGIPEGPYIVSAGLEMRDYETLIKAADALPVKVVIAVGSPWSNLEFSSPIVSPPANVHLDSFARPEMRELYRCASFVVVPVRQTDRACGMNVVLEAWAMKRPVIATRTKGLVDYIEDGHTGMFVDVGDVDDLRSAILYLLQHPAEARRLAENGHRHVSAELTIEQYLQRVTDAITHMLD